MEYQATGFVAQAFSSNVLNNIPLLEDLSSRKAPRILGVEWAVTGNLEPTAAAPHVETAFALLAGNVSSGISTFGLDLVPSIIPGTFQSVSAEIAGGTPVGGFSRISNYGIYIPPFEIIIPFDSVTLWSSPVGDDSAGTLRISVKIHYDLKTVKGEDLYALTLQYT